MAVTSIAWNSLRIDNSGDGAQTGTVRINLPHSWAVAQTMLSTADRMAYSGIKEFTRFVPFGPFPVFTLGGTFNLPPFAQDDNMASVLGQMTVSGGGAGLMTLQVTTWG